MNVKIKIVFVKLYSFLYKPKFIKIKVWCKKSIKVILKVILKVKNKLYLNIYLTTQKCLYKLNKNLYNF